MKRKIVFVLLILILAVSLLACGQSNAENQPDVEGISNVADISVEEPVEAESNSTNEESDEIIESTNVEDEQESEAIEEVTEITFTAEDGLEKVNRLLDAYSELIASQKEVEWNILDRCEKLTPEGSINPKTADGYELNPVDASPYGGTASRYVGINYFYNFVNNNCEYYDFTQYIESHTLEEILCENVSKEFSNKECIGELDSNYALFGEAIGCISYIRQFENIEVDKFVEGDNCTFSHVSGIDIEYELTLILDGEDSGMVVVFDKEGNMLNINTENAYDKFEYIFTFNAQ